jgi:hypothetical protein
MWRDWQRLGARLTAFESMATAHFQAVARLGSSAPGVMEMIRLVRDEAETVRELLDLFVRGNHEVLPEEALDAVERFKAQFPRTGDLQAVAQLQLISIRLHAELSYILSDIEEHVVHLAERGFLHLQRSLVVDIEVRAKWEAAFKTGEVACEGLGSVHLLNHGVWAFKASASGERTDLILGVRLVVDDAVRHAAVGMTLTEWKVVRHGDDPFATQARAIGQAKRYSEGSLAGFEVQKTRFIVMISEDHLGLARQVLDGNVTYRIVNIAVAPSPPSKSGLRVTGDS